MDNEDDFEPMEQDKTIPKLDDEAELIPFTGWTQTFESLASVTGNLVNQLGVGTG